MSKHDQEHSDIERRLFQIAETLSAEERNPGMPRGRFLSLGPWHSL